jgi:hypothetical protein
VFNKIEGSNFQIKDETGKGRLLQPVPIDLTLNLSILTRYQSDMDQCISNFVPYCDPYFVISWRIPEMPDHEIRSQVVWSGTINYTYPTDLNSTTVARYQTDTSFTLKGWLFKSFAQGDKTILTINTTIEDNTLTDSELPLSDLYAFDKLDKGYTQVKFALSAIPQPLHVDTYVVHTSSVKTITLFGHSYFDIRNIYLSGAPYKNISTLQTPFSTSTELSSSYPNFYGVRIEPGDFLQINQNTVQFTMPSATYPGFFDVIVENKGGYGSLIQRARKNTYNPYYPGTQAYNNFIPYNPPFLSGIQVLQILPTNNISTLINNQLFTINGNLLMTI